MAAGFGTCMDLRPQDGSLLLVGLDSGYVVLCSLGCQAHSFDTLQAHRAPLRTVHWNR